MDRDGMATKHVVVYNKPGCISCRAVEQYLTSRGIPYIYKDITLDAQAWQEFLDLGGCLVTPVTVVDGEAVIGFNRQRLAELLER